MWNSLAPTPTPKSNLQPAGHLLAEFSQDRYGRIITVCPDCKTLVVKYHHADRCPCYWSTREKEAFAKESGPAVPISSALNLKTDPRGHFEKKFNQGQIRPVSQHQPDASDFTAV